MNEPSQPLAQPRPRRMIRYGLPALAGSLALGAALFAADRISPIPGLEPIRERLAAHASRWAPPEAADQITQTPPATAVLPGSPAPVAASLSPEATAPSPRRPSSPMAALQAIDAATQSAPADADILAYASPSAGAEGNAHIRPPLAAPSMGTAGLPPVTLEEPVMLAIDAQRTRAIIASYRKGDIAEADAAAASIADPLTRLTLEWAGLRLQPRLMGFRRLTAFMDDHPHWPSNAWFENRVEDMAFGDNLKEETVRAVFDNRAPETPSGKIALARLIRDKEPDKAKALVTALWRNETLNLAQERAILREFGGMLGKEDHRFRASRLLYAQKNAAALRAAGEAGKEAVALARVRIAGQKRPLTDKEIARLPKAEQADPGLAYARINRLRRAGQYAEAAELLLKAPTKAVEVVDGDAWWTERRIVARQMLDDKQWDKAYRIAADHAAVSGEELIDAEFHAGWIALRFLNEGKGDTDKAAVHFEKAARVATSPISIARTAYWQGRAAEAAAKAEAAQTFYRRAAEYRTTYYGQLASAQLGIDEMALRAPERPFEGEARHASVRAVELLYAIGAEDLAFPLIADAARTMTDERQLAALADVLRRQRDARAILVLGKLATQRGLPLDAAAFPDFGVPAFERVHAESADLPLVYAIARQESAFQPAVVSHAGAKGLMQMLTATARSTATRAGVEFDERRLTSDPRFNAQLGAAHLGELLEQNRGSYILTFIAYNAGPKRVQEWIERFGDPRDPAVDVIDWIERIPFPETRNYVQRISENLQVYRTRLGQPNRLTIKADLRRVVRQ